MLKHFTLTILLLCIVGCRRDVTTNTPVSPGVLAGLPISLTVKQRSTNDVPGSDAKLMLTADDITNGQVLVFLNDANGRAILGSISMRQDDLHRFAFESFEYTLTLVKLNNALIGEDFATFRIALESGPTEDEKIERLIQFIGSIKDASFVRNGKHYSAEEAAEHLRTKWSTAGNSIETAQQFIDKIASRSSVTGKEYTVTQQDGTSIEVAVLLCKQLTKLVTPQPSEVE